MGRLDGKRVLVTGGANGIGAATVEAAITEGASVMIADIDADSSATFADRLGAQASSVTLDVREPEQWQAAVAATVDALGGLDVLVNNAGFGGGHLETLESLDYETMRRMVDINLIGAALGIQAVIPAMRDSGGGSIVNIGSNTGVLTMNGLSIYAATKAALNSLTKTAAMELGPVIRVNAVLPGSVYTDMSNLMGMDYETFSSTLGGMPLKRAAKAAEIAEPVIFFASDAARHCTGAELLIDAGQSTGIYFQMLPGHPDTGFRKLTKAGPDKFKEE